MAVGTILLSYKQRNQILYIIVILCILQSILGGAITGPSIYIFISVAPIVSGESAEIKFVFATTGIFGTHVFFHWLIGITLTKRCYYHARKKSTRNLLLLWSCAGSHTVINLIIIASLSRKLNKQIGRAMKNSIQTSMKNYLRDEHVKVNMDNLQYYQRCCGIYSHLDWQEISWLSKYEVDIKSEEFKRYREGEENMHLPIVPWSCCKLEFPTQCLHDPLQQQAYSHLWKNEPTIVTNSINSGGCLDIVWKPISLMLTIMAVLMSMVAVLHVIIFCLARILYTSCRNVFLLEDQKGISPGWIFGRGDCGYFRGKTLSQIMVGVEQKGPPEPDPKPANKEKKPMFNKLRQFAKSRGKSKKQPHKKSKQIETDIESSTQAGNHQSSREETVSKYESIQNSKYESIENTDRSSIPENILLNLK